MGNKSEEELIREVEQRLMAAFVELPTDLVANAVQDAYARFDESAIRDYVPLLVERRAHRDLTRAAA
ncbi:hypothetical protein A5634_17025 [Mycobacterium asiaticum]|uniref:DUF3562 domain-containing protein n=1 Tax=Mycobacterium asiaticum TaxID=1790 RepID=A0A1A3P734_MYCAS|nr:hypothetical protein A5634_17025 [Mycobacterium asiaticum]